MPENDDCTDEDREIAWLLDHGRTQFWFPDEKAAMNHSRHMVAVLLKMAWIFLALLAAAVVFVLVLLLTGSN
jgi:hypothetical protein